MRNANGIKMKTKLKNESFWINDSLLEYFSETFDTIFLYSSPINNFAVLLFNNWAILCALFNIADIALSKIKFF